MHDEDVGVSNEGRRESVFFLGLHRWQPAPADTTAQRQNRQVEC